MPAQPFRYPTQNLDDLELTEEVPVRSTGMTASMVEAAFGTPHPKSAEHLLVWQEPVIARDGTLTMRRVYRRLPGAPLSGEMVRESTWGAPATVTTQDVATGTHADTGLNVIESVVEPKDAQTARKRTTTVDWPTLTARSVEPATRTPLTVTRQIVPAGTELVPQTSLMVDQEIRAIDKWRSIRIVTSLDTLPAAFQEQKHLRFRFPGLFYGYDSSTGIVQYRHAISRVVAARVNVGFGYEEVEPVLYEIKPVSWIYPLGFSVSSVLTNGEQFSYEKSATVLVSVTVPLSSPTRAEYEALIGTYVTVTGASERWKGGVFRTELWQVKLE